MFNINEIEKNLQVFYNKNIDKYNKSLDFNNALKIYVLKLAQKYGYQGRKSIKIECNEDNKNRVLDVMWMNHFESIAFEIDSAFRKKSINKLSKAQADYKIWIYCGEKDVNNFLHKFDGVEEIKVINLDGYRRIFRNKKKY